MIEYNLYTIQYVHVYTRASDHITGSTSFLHQCFGRSSQLHFSSGGVPFLPSEAWCVREWNRKNAAEINFKSSKVIEPGFQYSIWLVVTNPHSPDAIDGPPGDPSTSW